MLELVEKFYKQDLTEAEEESLDALLETSPEAADRFADLADAAYAGFGLPDPLGVRPKRWNIWTWISLVSLMFAGYGWWVGKRDAKVPSVQLEGKSPADQARQGPSRLKTPVASQDSQGSNLSVGTKEDQRLSGAENPDNSGTNATKTKHSRLKITVDISQSGPVTVRIVSMEGRVIRDLFAGPVAAGPNAFTWDCTLSNGAPAPPGNYRLVVQGAGRLETRYFTVGKK